MLKLGMEGADPQKLSRATLRPRLHTYPDIYIYIFYPELFFFWFKNFHVHVQIPCVFKSNAVTVQTYPTRIRIHFSTQYSARNIGNRACVVKHSKSAFCSAFHG